MGVLTALRLALGGNPPAPAALPVMPPLVVIAINVRTAELWLREQGLRASGRIRLVTPDRPERLRGMYGIDLVWVNPSDWWSHPKVTELCNYVAMLRATGALKAEREVWV